MKENGGTGRKKSKWKKYCLVQFCKNFPECVSRKCYRIWEESSDAAELKQSRNENLLLFLCKQIAQAIKKSEAQLLKHIHNRQCNTDKKKEIFEMQTLRLKEFSYFHDIHNKFN